MRFFTKLAIVGFFSVIFVLLVLYGKGYRLNLQTKEIQPTGIIAISSSPKPASVYLNGKLLGATDANFSLEPGKWLVEVKKEGYTSWQKQVDLKPGVVISLQAQLFPKNPSLKPLTSMGVVKAVRVDNLDKLLLFVKGEKEGEGVYLFEISRAPLRASPEPKKLFSFSQYTDVEKLDIESLNPIFSPDFGQFVLELENRKYLISLEGGEVVDVTSSFSELKKVWEKQKEKETLSILKSFPEGFEKIATSSAKIIAFSPDETKLLYKADKHFELPIFLKKPLKGANPAPETRKIEKGKLYVYDRKEDKNYLINAPSNTEPLWYIDSRRLIFIKDSSIVVVDYDGENERVIYSGPFEKEFLAVTSDGNLLILLNLNKKLNPYPDVYELIINS